eukprot:365499-Chlamydomonas_euryale.AAC.4
MDAGPAAPPVTHVRQHLQGHVGDTTVVAPLGSCIMTGNDGIIMQGHGLRHHSGGIPGVLPHNRQRCKRLNAFTSTRVRQQGPWLGINTLIISSAPKLGPLLVTLTLLDRQEHVVAWQAPHENAASGMKMFIRAEFSTTCRITRTYAGVSCVEVKDCKSANASGHHQTAGPTRDDRIVSNAAADWAALIVLAFVTPAANARASQQRVPPPAPYGNWASGQPRTLAAEWTGS